MSGKRSGAKRRRDFIRFDWSFRGGPPKSATADLGIIECRSRVNPRSLRPNLKCQRPIFRCCFWIPGSRALISGLPEIRLEMRRSAIADLRCARPGMTGSVYSVSAVRKNRGESLRPPPRASCEDGAGWWRLSHPSPPRLKSGFVSALEKNLPALDGANHRRPPGGCNTIAPVRLTAIVTRLRQFRTRAGTRPAPCAP